MNAIAKTIRTPTVELSATQIAAGTHYGKAFRASKSEDPAIKRINGADILR